MRILLGSAALALAMMMCGTASAADRTQPTDATLAKMGLSTIQVMSDAEGQQIRGKFAVAYSFSWVSGGSPNLSTSPPNSMPVHSFSISGSGFAYGSASASTSP